jgi:membrane protease YdiL (CAAX protease family)
MLDNQSKGVSYTAGFFILLAFTIGGILVANQLSAFLFEVITGKTFDIDAIPVASDTNALRLMQVINTLIGFVLPAIATAYMLDHKPFTLLGFTGSIRREQLGLTVLIIGTALIVSSSLSWFNNHFPISQSWETYFKAKEKSYNQHMEAIVNMQGLKDYLISLVLLGFLPALSEEVLFRGGLQNFLSRGTKRPWLSIIAVSILFSLAHFSFYGFLSRLFLGIVLGALFHYSGKLWLCILGHFINNALVLTILFTYTQKGKPIKEAMQVDPATWWGILILPMVVGLFILFKRTSAARRAWSNH